MVEVRAREARVVARERVRALDRGFLRRWLLVIILEEPIFKKLAAVVSMMAGWQRKGQAGSMDGWMDGWTVGLLPTMSKRCKI